MWHLLYGPNDIARDDEIARMRSILGADEIAAMNITMIEMTAPLKDIQAACDTVSFLADKRMVIARNWLTKPGIPKRKQPKDSEDHIGRLITYLPEIPETTALVLIEDSTLAESHALVKLAREKNSGGREKCFDLPGDVVKWITERVTAKGGRITPPAAQMLATRINRGDKNDRDHFAEDNRLYLRKLDNELDKLTGYTNGRRIESTDIELLVADEEISDMFKFVDAVSVRDGHTAYRQMLSILSRGEQPLVIMTMLARQTRLMICAKENDSLPNDTLATTMNVSPFVAKKAAQQASRFRMDELVRAHLAIAEIDVSIKTGRMDELAALDMMVALLCGAG